MWAQLQRWRGWAANAFSPRGKRQVQGIEFAYEKAGLSVRNEPLAWNAEAVRVEATLRAPGLDDSSRGEFSLLRPGAPPAPATTFEPAGGGLVRVGFRLLPLTGPTGAELLWRSFPLGKLTLPYVSQEEFLRSLRVESAALVAELGKYAVPCEAVVADQCRGLRATALLTSPTSLLPLLDLDLSVTFTDHGTHSSQTLSVGLSLPQLTARQALLSVGLPGWPWPPGPWSVRWTAAGRWLGGSAACAVSPQEFRQSLYLIDGRYACERTDGQRAHSPYLPPREGVRRVGPCFRVASREPGVAGLCTLELRTRFIAPDRPGEVLRQEVLVSDGPSLFVPPLRSVEEFEQVASFDLYARGELLGSLAGCRRPVVHFTTEGGFREPADFDWTPVAEQELAERLRRLMDVPEPRAAPAAPAAW
jgi:hypothetical protein